MSASQSPIITLHPLRNASGSASYTSPRSNSVFLSGVNYPVEVPYRSDELPNTTYIEVLVRPHNGVAMVKERHVEEVIRRTLMKVVRGQDTPRSMLQVTVQVMTREEDEYRPGGVKGGGGGQGDGYLEVLVGSLNATVAGCLDGGVMMDGIFGAVLVGVHREGTKGVIVSPTVEEQKSCRSLHAFAFDNNGQCLLLESEGYFGLEEWEEAEALAKVAVCGDTTTNDRSGDINGDLKMQSVDAVEQKVHFLGVLRNSVEQRVAEDERWKE